MRTTIAIITPLNKYSNHTGGSSKLAQNPEMHS